MRFATGFRGVPTNPYKLRRQLRGNFFPPGTRTGACIFLYKKDSENFCDESKLWHETFFGKPNVDFLQVFYPYEPYGFIYHGQKNWIYTDYKQAIQKFESLIKAPH